MSRARVLIVDDKSSFCELLRRILPPDLDVESAADGRAALAILERSTFDVVIADLRMPKLDGLALLAQIKAKDPTIEVILMTAYGTIPSAVAAMKLGACEYLTKPFETDAAVNAVQQALARRGRAGEPRPPRSYREALDVERGRAVKNYLVNLLLETGGNVTLAAEKAGIERESLHRLLRRHGVKSEDYRPKR